MWSALAAAIAAVGLCCASDAHSLSAWAQAAASYEAATSKADYIFEESFEVLKRAADLIIERSNIIEEEEGFLGNVSLPETPCLRSDSFQLPFVHSGPHMSCNLFIVRQKMLNLLGRIAPGSVHITEHDISLSDAEILLKAALKCRHQLNIASVAVQTAIADCSMDNTVIFALCTTFMFRAGWFSSQIEATAWLQRARMILRGLSFRVASVREHVRTQALLTQDCAYWSELFNGAVKMLSLARHSTRTTHAVSADSAAQLGNNTTHQQMYSDIFNTFICPEMYRKMALKSLESRYLTQVALLDFLRDYELNLVKVLQLAVHTVCANIACAALTSAVAASQSDVARQSMPEMLQKIIEMQISLNNSLTDSVAANQFLEPQLLAEMQASIKADRFAKYAFDLNSALLHNPDYIWSSFVRVLSPLYDSLPTAPYWLLQVAALPGENSRVVALLHGATSQFNNVVQAANALLTAESENAYLQSLERVLMAVASYRAEFSKYTATRMGAYTSYYVGQHNQQSLQQ